MMVDMDAGLAPALPRRGERMSAELLAECPKEPSHKRFVTVAHVAEDWLVDEHGNFIESRGCTETVAPPTKGNTWTCAECGAEATVT
jgi:hypothetical protein